MTALSLGASRYRAKQQVNLKRHRALVHDIGVTTWYDCPEPNCSFKSKQESSIKKHRAHGVNWQACTELR